MIAGDDRLERISLRLKGFDYSTAGCYFITVCTQGKQHLFWDRMVFVGADIIRPHLPELTALGQAAEKTIQDISNHYPSVLVDKYVVMPNHIHMILRLEEKGRMISAPTKSVSTIVGQMKRASSKLAGSPLWQKGYYDRIIRDEAEYLRIWNYIDTNPAQWAEDEYYEEADP